MATVRLDTLIDRAYKAADQEDRALCDSTEVTTYLNRSIKRFRDWLSINHISRFQKKVTFPTVATVDTYSFATAGCSDLATLLNVFWDANVGRLLRMEECPPNEDEYVIPGTGWNYNYTVRYELLQEQIRFVPTPQSVMNVTLKYVPTFTDLVANSDTVEMYNGWEDWPVENAAAMMAEKQDDAEKAAACMRRRDEAGKVILALAKRNRGEPKRVQDATRPVGRWWY